ncbi:MAG: DUF3018 family protein [Fibrobacteres bacterium]|nr:DUF3018 family protein [Fibrobacterota bacterium]
MDKTSTDRKRKHMEKMRARHLKLVQVWVPETRVLEINSVAARMMEEGHKGSRAKSKTTRVCSIFV